MLALVPVIKPRDSSVQELFNVYTVIEETLTIWKGLCNASQRWMQFFV